MASPLFLTTKLFRSHFSPPISIPSAGFAKLFRAQLPPPPFGARSLRPLRSLAFPATGSEAKSGDLTKRRSQPMLTLFDARSVHFVALLSSDSDTDSDSDWESDSESDPESSSILEVSVSVSVSEAPFKNPLVVGGSVESYTIREDDEAKYGRFDMPGIGKEDVKVWVEKNTLMIKGVLEASDSETTKRSYLGSIELEEGWYVIDQIRAEVNNGVLKVVIPKVKLEDRSDVLLIKVN